MSEKGTAGVFEEFRYIVENEKCPKMAVQMAYAHSVRVAMAYKWQRSGTWMRKCRKDWLETLLYDRLS